LSKTHKIELTLDLSASNGMYFLPSSGVIKKVLKPGETLAMIKAIANPIEETYSKKIKPKCVILQ